MKFLAQIKKIVVRKTVSLDKEVEVVLITEDTNPLALGVIPSDENVLVTIEKEKV
jgi:anti-sigma-K factor RskA